VKKSAIILTLLVHAATIFGSGTKVSDYTDINLAAYKKIKQYQNSTKQGFNLFFNNDNFRNLNKKTCNLRNVRIKRSSFDHTNFENSDLQSSRLRDSKLTYANFYQANLRGVNFYKSDLSNATFNHTNLTETNFSLAIISNADFSKAKGYIKYIKEGLSLFHGIYASRSEKNPISIGHFRTSFNSSIAYKTNFSYTMFIEASFHRAYLKEANLSNSLFAYTSFYKVDSLENADFTNTTLYGSDFSNTDVTLTKKWKNADFYAVQFSEDPDEKQQQQEHLARYGAINVYWKEEPIHAQ